MTMAKASHNGINTHMIMESLQVGGYQLWFHLERDGFS